MQLNQALIKWKMRWPRPCKFRAVFWASNEVCPGTRHFHVATGPQQHQTSQYPASSDTRLNPTSAGPGKSYRNRHASVKCNTNFASKTNQRTRRPASTIHCSQTLENEQRKVEENPFVCNNKIMVYKSRANRKPFQSENVLASCSELKMTLVRVCQQDRCLLNVCYRLPA